MTIETSGAPSRSLPFVDISCRFSVIGSRQNLFFRPFDMWSSSLYGMTWDNTTGVECYNTVVNTSGANRVLESWLKRMGQMNYVMTARGEQESGIALK